MAHKKGGGTSRNNRDSNAQRRGVKLFAGEVADTGSIIIRQCGTKFLPGTNVGCARDYSLFALKPGVVKFIGRKVHVLPSEN